MFKKINLEHVNKPIKEYRVKKNEIISAIENCVKQIDTNMDVFLNRFPSPGCKNDRYDIIDNIEWTNGFWTGLLWLAYEYTHDEKYQKLACDNILSFKERIDKMIELDHHDLGFLYSLSCVAGYKLIDNQIGKESALKACDKLISRFQNKGEFIQAWGQKGNPDHYRFIVDCLLNIPLLYWGSEVSGNPIYKEIADKHFKTSCLYAIRDDASTFHTFYMDPITGEPLKGVTRQGFSDDSSWARGQAWAIYGMALNYRYTKNPNIIPMFKAVSNYFINRLPKDYVCYWDLIFDDTSNQSKDSSAAAIAVCGFLEMSKYLEPNDSDLYLNYAHTIMHSLISNYTSTVKKQAPILYHGVYSYHSGRSVDEGNIWGDYFYLEALIRLYKHWEPYW